LFRAPRSYFQLYVNQKSQIMLYVWYATTNTYEYYSIYPLLLRNDLEIADTIALNSIE
jgi:hypothetical protein